MREPSAPPSPGLSRRNVLGAAASLAAAPLLAATARASAPLASASGLASAVAHAQTRPRFLHAALGLPDGRVMVIGGYGVSESTRAKTGAAPTSSVQIYDPTSETWVDLAPLRLPRARHAAVLLPDNRIVVLGGFYVAPTASVEIYDPYANVWSEGAALPIPLVDHAASLCTDGILITGGQTGTPALLLPFPG